MKHTIIVAEIGINHNGNVDTACSLVSMAKRAGCDYVKFQKRNPDICVPAHCKNDKRDTIWGSMTYLDYRKKIELSENDYNVIDKHCKSIDMAWFASSWDIPSLEFINSFSPQYHKIPSALLTNPKLLEAVRKTGVTAVLSTGMSTMEQIIAAIKTLGGNTILLHCTSSYPTKLEEINLNVISVLQSFGLPVGYSGHETGIGPSVAAVAMGAVMIERHITLDRDSSGSDHWCSLSEHDLNMLVDSIRQIDVALGNGVKKVYESELPSLRKLRYSDS